MQARVAAGLFIGTTSFAFAASAFGGCSGWTQDGQLIGTDKPVSIGDGCVYVYENSFLDDGTRYQEDAPDGTPCKDNWGTCQSGICVEKSDIDASIDAPADTGQCVADGDCPNVECQTRKCNNGTCEYTAVSDIDCKLTVAGGTTRDGVCDQGVCSECTPTNTTHCPTGDTSTPYCNSANECVTCSNFSKAGCKFCQNNTKDGTEKGIDCGNDACGKCNGESCAFDTQCASGHCVDGFCCDSACTGTCMTCAGQVRGTCIPVMDGREDDTCSKFPKSFCFEASADSANNRCYFRADAFCVLDGLDPVPSFCTSGECQLSWGVPICTKGDKSDYCVGNGDCISNKCNADKRCDP